MKIGNQNPVTVSSPLTSVQAASEGLKAKLTSFFSQIARGDHTAAQTMSNDRDIIKIVDELTVAIQEATREAFQGAF